MKSWLIGKDSDAGRVWEQEEKGTTEDEMARWHHWLDVRESEWTPGDGDGQGGLACCDSWGSKELDTTEQLNWTEVYAEIPNPIVLLAVALSYLAMRMLNFSSLVFTESNQLFSVSLFHLQNSSIDSLYSYDSGFLLLASENFTFIFVSSAISQLHFILFIQYLYVLWQLDDGYLGCWLNTDFPFQSTDQDYLG